MPQVRDPKTGRYTSGGGSSIGGAAGTNPRIQKAKAVGSGATAGGASSPATKPTSGAPQVDESMQPVSDSLYSKLDGATSPYGEGKVQIKSPNEFAVTVEVGGRVYDKVYQVRDNEWRWEQDGNFKALFKSAKEASSAVIKQYESEGFKK